MKTYGFDFLDASGQAQSVDVGEFHTDTDAIRRASEQLFASLTAVAVDIWRDGLRVAHIDRHTPNASTSTEAAATPSA